MNPEGSDLAAALRAGLEKQIALYRQIKQLSAKQRPLIAANDVEGLLRLLAEKQEIIAAAAAEAEKLGPWQERWEAARANVPEAERQVVEAAAADLRQILAEIVALEDEGQAAALSVREAAGAALTRLQKGKAMHKAYGGGRPPGGAVRGEG
ncbi:MAG: flagellar export chaperone FlgN [Planctomycetota bacterium]|nr:flagellar export chaperone FlgN [Planctomycetota bacterium]